MFLDIDKKEKLSMAAIDDEGRQITYGELCSFTDEFYAAVNKRTLIFILSENNVGSLAGYVASLSSRVVPLLLGATTDKDLLQNLLITYQPEFIWMPKRLQADFDYQHVLEKYDWVLVKTGFDTAPMHEDLSMLLPTSGSTGSPKLVRHSYTNISANAGNVAQLFELTINDRAIAILPMYYTMGLSVISSHLYAGATLLLVKSNLTDGSFWKFIKEHKATSFTGVPYSYDIMKKLRFFRMDLPDLTLLSQGGGKLSAELFTEFAEFAQNTGKRFIATYGQTEGTARMAYLPAEMALEKVGSIGRAIPNGQLSIIDAEGVESTEGEATGEMVYRGPNVTMGYALNREDLTKGDERNGYLSTGDIARRDADGCYYIVGRLSRFLKLFGTRVSLDETEQMIKAEFKLDCACTGNDEKMTILVTDEDAGEQIIQFVSHKTGLFHKAFEVVAVDEIKRNEAGKVIYQSIAQ
jgi:acyl-coenzyme A synthetase/AMP-(fatty) acid ligase